MKYTTKLTGAAGTTVRVAATDVSQAIADAIFFNNGKPAISLQITCETQNLRFAFNTTPTQGDSGLGHILYVGQTILIDGGSLARSLRFVNHTNGSDGFIQVTPFFEMGDA